MHQTFYQSLTWFTILMLTACQTDRDKGVDRDRFTFTTGDDTEIFFKNMRQSEYDIEEMENAGLRVFRHEDRPEGDSILFIIPAIVMSVLRDEAYILPEPSLPLLEEETLEIALSGAGTVDTLRLESRNRESNLEFSVRIYEHIASGGDFHVHRGEEWLPIYTSEGEREVFRITMIDYFRLTRIFK